MEENIKLFNKDPFKVLVISSNTIQDKDWQNPNYLNDLVNGNYCNYVNINPANYLDDIATHLKITRYTDPYIKVQMVSEEKDYIYELMYVEILEGVSTDFLGDEKDNEFATLLNINGDIVYGNAILMKTFVSTINNDMYFENITNELVKNVIYRRAHTKVVIYDSDQEAYSNIEVFGPMDEFANDFFSEYKYKIKKIELGFLKHNINIWYSEDTYGILDVCGNLIPELARVNKMIVFSMWSDTYRDSFTLEEFNKIIFLSKKLKSYDLPANYCDDEQDENGRLIVKNKYRILHKYFEENK